MAITLKILGTGKIGPAGNVLYTPPTGKSAVVKTISLVNNHTAPTTFNLYVSAGVNYPISPASAWLPAGAQALWDDPITLGAGQSIVASSSSTSKVEALVFGIERDA